MDVTERRFVLRKHSTTALIRVTGFTLVALLSLASGRSLIPGLCATQAALDDGAVAVGCCDHSSQRSPDGYPEIHADSDVVCAFCNLATTLVTTTVSVGVATTDAPALVGPAMAAALMRANAIDRTHAGRAPPVLFAV